MKVWFDLSNSPHINLFYDLIRDLEDCGHEVVITCRPLANTVDLLDQRGLKYTIVGQHYGKKLHKKVLGYPIRVWQLKKFLQGMSLDLAVSQSSFHSPLVATLLGIPSIYTNDNEHALGNLPSLMFANKILVPENSSVGKGSWYKSVKRKISQYPGLKEGIYLWRLGERIYQHRQGSNNYGIKIYVRPEPLTAQYYKGGLNFLDDALIELQKQFSITILPRDATQSRHYKQDVFKHLTVPEKPLSFVEIANDCSLFIGAGGSMTREMAILGIPTISVYQDVLLDVDSFLIERNLMAYEPEINAAKILKRLGELEDSTPDLDLLNKGKQAYNFLKSEILKFDKKKVKGQSAKVQKVYV